MKSIGLDQGRQLDLQDVPTRLGKRRPCHLLAIGLPMAQLDRLGPNHRNRAVQVLDLAIGLTLEDPRAAGDRNRRVEAHGKMLRHGDRFARYVHVLACRDQVRVALQRPLQSGFQIDLRGQRQRRPGRKVLRRRLRPGRKGQNQEKCQDGQNIVMLHCGTGPWNLRNLR